MRGTRAFALRLFLAIVVACSIVAMGAAMGACSLGPKQDDPLNGGEDTGGASDAAIGPDGPFGFDAPPSDTGKAGSDASSDTIGPFDDCDGGDAYPDGGCVPPVPTDGGDADAPSDAPLDAPLDAPSDAPSDAVDDGDAGDVVVGG
jgi:hypothetical protein